MDLFEECQEQKKMVGRNAEVIAEGNNLISKIRECEAQINRDNATIKSLESENIKLSKQIQDMKSKSGLDQTLTSKSVTQVQSELRQISRDLRDLISSEPAAGPSPGGLIIPVMLAQTARQDPAPSSRRAHAGCSRAPATGHRLTHGGLFDGPTHGQTAAGRNRAAKLRPAGIA